MWLLSTSEMLLGDFMGGETFRNPRPTRRSKITSVVRPRQNKVKRKNASVVNLANLKWLCFLNNIVTLPLS